MINWQNAYNTPGWMLWRDLILLGTIAKHTAENSNFIEIANKYSKRKSFKKKSLKKKLKRPL